MAKQIKTYSYGFFRNVLADGAGDTNTVELRNIEGGRRRRLVSFTTFFEALNAAGDQRIALISTNPGVGAAVLAYVTLTEIVGVAAVGIKFYPDVVTPGAGVGINNVRFFNINEKITFADFSFNEAVRIQMQIINEYGADIYYRMNVYAEIEVQ